MVNKTVPKNTLAEGYQENNGIVIQFILFELIQAYEHVYAVEARVKEIFSPIETVPEASLNKALKFFAESMGFLAGAPQRSMRIFTANLNEGILAQLKNYTSFFANNLDPRDRESLSLQRNAARAWVHALDCLDMVRVLRAQADAKRNDLGDFMSSFQKMFHRLQKLAQGIAGILHHFREDENVVFFIVSQSRRLDGVYGRDFVLEIIHKMFPEGMHEVELFLTEQYTARGFHHLIPVIIEKISELELALV